MKRAKSDDEVFPCLSAALMERFLPELHENPDPFSEVLVSSLER